MSKGRTERRKIYRKIKKDLLNHLNNRPKFDLESDDNLIEIRKWEVRKQSLENLLKKYENSKSFIEKDN